MGVQALGSGGAAGPSPRVADRDRRRRARAHRAAGYASPRLPAPHRSSSPRQSASRVPLNRPCVLDGSTRTPPKETVRRWESARPARALNVTDIPHAISCCCRAEVRVAAAEIRQQRDDGEQRRADSVKRPRSQRTADRSTMSERRTSAAASMLGAVSTCMATRSRSLRCPGKRLARQSARG